MFENIIEQGAVSQLHDDILSGCSAPSMLFYGPSGSGKGSAALELARVFSCEGEGCLTSEGGGSWKCSCPSCGRHRYLLHDDLLLLGKRSFSAEIAAYCSVFLRSPANKNTKLLFYRSLRKLQLRFSPVLMEDDPKFGKIASLLQSFDERLSDFLSLSEDTEDKTALEKLCGLLVKDALALETDGMSANIPIGHIRRAAYWCRLSPNGRRKTLIIENAENMRDEARNSLLKLLEEPPVSLSIVLTSQRREVIIPTILSRLRPYRFLKRSVEGEKDVLRRVFQHTHDEESPKTGNSLITSYLDSFLPANKEKLYPLAAWFVVSLARITALKMKKKEISLPPFLTGIGDCYASIAETAGFERSVKSSEIIKTLLVKSSNFEDDSFSRFLKLCLDLIAETAKKAEDHQYISYYDIFKKSIGEAAAAVDVLNQSPALALEALFYNLKKAMLNKEKVWR
ncbi:MAG: DNA polymerase III [Treponema sp.]|nr:DNA polymerase III [Treponema sp.]